MRLETERLILRPWRDQDLGPFAAMSADPEVMRWLGGVLTREAAAAYMARSESSFSTRGMGRFAIERRDDGAFIGSCGLMPGRPSMPIAPYTDIGWRLARSAWGGGYATEAAAAVLRDGFGRLRLDEIAAVTAAINLHSRAVMERLGMTWDKADNFNDPAYAIGHPQRRTVVYRAHA